MFLKLYLTPLKLNSRSNNVQPIVSINYIINYKIYSDYRHEQSSQIIKRKSIVWLNTLKRIYNYPLITATNENLSKYLILVDPLRKFITKIVIT